MRPSLEWEVWGSNLEPIKSDTVLPTACHPFDIFVYCKNWPRRNDAEMGPANLLHAMA